MPLYRAPDVAFLRLRGRDDVKFGLHLGEFGTVGQAPDRADELARAVPLAVGVVERQPQDPFVVGEGEPLGHDAYHRHWLIIQGDDLTHDI